jgi:CGNR zinc finger protein/putative stress-induced transcription regulator
MAYDAVMATTRIRQPQPVHGPRTTHPAPGNLELVRGLLSLHDHEVGTDATLPPDPGTMRWWLVANGLVPEDAELTDGEVDWALRVRDALLSTVRENMGEPQDDRAVTLLNEATRATGLQLCFGCHTDRVHIESEGVEGAIARLLGLSLLAQLDGTWTRFRTCADPTCTGVFYDASKNHSRKWCSMQSCGNRNKVRSFRERERSAQGS